MQKVNFFPANLQNEKREKGARFVVTYHTIQNSLNKIIQDNMYLINMNEEVRKTFSPRSMVSFRSAQWLSSYSDWDKLYPLQRKVGSSKCGKRWYEVCNNVTDTTIFSSTVTGDTFNINHSLNCDDNRLIYLETCKECHKQYTGETTDHFHNRWNNYKDQARTFDRKESCMQEHLHKHFWRVKFWKRGAWQDLNFERWVAGKEGGNFFFVNKNIFLYHN